MKLLSKKHFANTSMKIPEWVEVATTQASRSPTNFVSEELYGSVFYKSVFQSFVTEAWSRGVAMSVFDEKKGSSHPQPLMLVDSMWPKGPGFDHIIRLKSIQS